MTLKLSVINTNLTGLIAKNRDTIQQASILKFAFRLVKVSALLRDSSGSFVDLVYNNIEIRIQTLGCLMCCLE